MACMRGAYALIILALVAAPTAAFAQPNCRNTGSFEAWLAEFKKEALAKGISPAAIAAASPYIVLDQRIINIDRGQRFFAQNFIEISDKMLPGGRLKNGVEQIKKHQALFAREEKEFGVPASVITAFWGLESDFGAGQGKDQAIKSLATLAYDCRRSDMFRGHLFDALRLIERGDLRADEMIGSWAGELGQTQMMPSEYMAHAIDYDGDGRRNLIKSVPDVIGSTGKYLVHLGWKRGEPWLHEVRVPASLPWKEADLSVQHPRSQWVSWGVVRADGKALPADNLPASIVLPVGRFGPAFLAYDNFQAYLKWNQSLNYSLTAAYYATRLDGAPPMHKGDGNIPKISFEETRELQQMLERRGYDVGRVDGVLGLKSRVAIRDMQIKFGQPADGWPTAELLARLRTAR
ncbi:MAG TPA: lytic murein transglycosylase [Xanthobacteraceae bacterium]|jgi:lytic murein transglycosylase